MATTKSHKTKNKQIEVAENPFIKLITDKEEISKAIQEGKPLSTLKGIRFVKPI
ncbi:hypothetical protein [Mucilaginibacter gracilis]|uniref:hypothetical protein n=1 Tax=Mucilaginibacter gracilis TaxID=423350 RepID=UPI0013C3723A|nr:hypothetical protein [Mucilaginibacter gracilis]